MQIELILLAFFFFFGALAIVIKLTGRLQRSWVERDLYVGDLRILKDIAFRRIAAPGFDNVERLCKRGFLVKTDQRQYRCRITPMGWVAVLLRNTSARRVTKLADQ